MTLWEYIIFIPAWLIISNHGSETLNQRWKAPVGQTIQQALEHGASTEVSIEILPIEGEQGPYISYVWRLEVLP